MDSSPASLPDLFPLKKGAGFSTDHFRASEAEYASEWSIVYETLRNLCRRYPNHTSRDAVAAKVWIIGRTYATQVERGVKSLGGQGSALDQVATAIHGKCTMLDDLISRIPDHQEALLDDAVVAACIHAHGGLSEILRPITTGRTPRSFASKSVRALDCYLMYEGERFRTSKN